jgi:prepilin peptidase CpaA
MTNANGCASDGTVAHDRTGTIWADASAAAVAALVVTCFVLSPSGSPLPAPIGSAAFLFLAIHQDVRGMRIPNWLTLPSLLGALALGAWNGALAGAGTALAGAGIALAVLFVPFALRVLGAGDVKAGMVLGALWGADAFLPALWWMVLAGGLLALVLLTAQGALPDLLRRWARSAKHSLLLRRIVYFPPAESSAAAGGLPFAVAMGLGAAAFQTWGTPWV